MKKILSLAVLLVFSLAMYAQKDVTKFLGIPVDGTKSEMIKKLKEKGFTESSYDKVRMTRMYWKANLMGRMFKYLL